MIRVPKIEIDVKLFDDGKLSYTAHIHNHENRRAVTIDSDVVQAHDQLKALNAVLDVLKKELSVLC